MLRISYFVIVAAALLDLISGSTEAHASDVGPPPGGLYGGFEYFYGWPPPFAGFYRLNRLPFAQSARPVGVGVPFLNDYYPFYSEYPPTPECVFERRPISNVYGLGWRNFIICYN
jgi:hypothetical protein